ncbi:NADAR family protein [Skermania piniformis]
MESAETTLVLGVDFGRVIQGGDTLDATDVDTQFLGASYHEALRSPPTACVFDVLPGLVEQFDGRVWIISKCGHRIREVMLGWLDHHDFYTRTGMPRGNIRTCAKRADKAVHCVDLGVTHMIDDRLDVHTHLRGIVPNLYLFGIQPATTRPPAWVTPVPNWEHAGNAIQASLKRVNHSKTRIDSFTGEHRFLSNFAPYPTVFDGIEYPTAEHAYIAAKTLDPDIRAIVRATPAPGSAKATGDHPPTGLDRGP